MYLHKDHKEKLLHTVHRHSSPLRQIQLHHQQFFRRRRAVIIYLFINLLVESHRTTSASSWKVASVALADWRSTGWRRIKANITGLALSSQRQLGH